MDPVDKIASDVKSSVDKADAAVDKAVVAVNQAVDTAQKDVAVATSWYKAHQTLLIGAALLLGLLLGQLTHLF